MNKKQKQIPHWPILPYTNEIPNFGIDFYRSLLNTINERVDDFDITIFDGLQNLDDLYNRIIECINEYVGLNENEKEKYPIENIFHMIQVWGGRTGRNIYAIINKKGVKETNAFKYNWSRQKYLNIVKKCLQISYDKDKGFNIQDLKNLVDVLNVNKMNQLGISFITKHVRFWTSTNLGNNALPIFDKVINGKLYGREKEPQPNELLTYWKHMIAKAKEKGIDLVPLERQLFLYNGPVNNESDQSQCSNVSVWEQLTKRHPTIMEDAQIIDENNCEIKLKNKHDIVLRLKVYKKCINNSYQTFGIDNINNNEEKNRIIDSLKARFGANQVDVDKTIFVRNTDCGKHNVDEMIEWFANNIQEIIKIIG